MTGDSTSFLVASFLLVMLGWLAACAEAGISRVSRFRAEEALRAGRRGADRLLTLASDPIRYLNLATLIRVASEMAAAVMVTVVCVRNLSQAWQAILLAFGVMVLVSFVAVGVSPRTIGRQHPLTTATAASFVLLPLAAILGPIPRLLILLGNALTPGKGYREGPFASEAELRALVDLAEKDDLIEDDERRMVHSVFELGDTIVREVMVPRTDLVMIERHKTVRQTLTLALRSGFSRIPVVGDNEDDVVGIVYLKDLVRRTHVNPEAESDQVDTVMRPAVFIPDSKPVDDLLREMQQMRSHVAIVIDEYGGTAGLVTIEDILEEIVGEITDEYDREIAPVQDLGDGSYRITARLLVEDLGELFGIELEDEDVETVGGLLAKHLGRVPIPGSACEIPVPEDGPAGSSAISAIRLIAESSAGRRNRIGTVVAAPVGPHQPDVRLERPELD